MADPWIKMRVTLPTCPQVVRLASAFDADKCPLPVRVMAAVGALHATWSLADAHTEDGTLTGYTLEVLDYQIGIPGWGQAMVDVGWLVVSPDGIAFPRFEDHNGSTRKRRDAEAERKRNVRKTSAPDADKRPQDDGTNVPLSLPLTLPLNSLVKDKGKQAPETWEQVLDRPAYEVLRANPAFGDAWAAWVEHAGERGTKARVPRGRQAATLLNEALRVGADTYARAINHGIKNNHQAPNPEWLPVLKVPQGGSQGALKVANDFLAEGA